MHREDMGACVGGMTWLILASLGAMWGATHLAFLVGIIVYKINN